MPTLVTGWPILPSFGQLVFGDPRTAMRGFSFRHANTFLERVNKKINMLGRGFLLPLNVVFKWLLNPL